MEQVYFPSWYEDPKDHHLSNTEQSHTYIHHSANTFLKTSNPMIFFTSYIQWNKMIPVF
jgi:hypothetical protein